MAEFVTAETLAGLPGLAHGFFTRRGGVSAGPFAALNCSLSGKDDAESVRENRRRAAGALGLPGTALAGLTQVHGIDVAVLDTPWPETDRPHADALVTRRPGLALGVVTADCAPVLLADTAAGVVGAAHAGWKGAVGGVTDSTIAAMEALGAQRRRIVAAIGPCIALASYEVDAAFLVPFLTQDAAHARFFQPGRPGHHQFDLEGYVAARLEAAEIGAVERLGLDTYPTADRFFSFRRATHRAEPAYGRQISLIGL